MFIIPLFLVCGKAQAASFSQTHLITSETVAPAVYRDVCINNNPPVDFRVKVTKPIDGRLFFDLDSGTLKYDINLEWQRCLNVTETRAYAIYSDPQICPVSGWYGVNNSEVTDCVKYIGSPAYTGSGNGLQCSAGFNDTCVSQFFSGARKAEQMPDNRLPNRSIRIPMSYTNPSWQTQDEGNLTTSHFICQFYKTKNSKGQFTILNSNSRCESVTIGVQWTALKDFKLSPSASVNLDNEEQPNTATFGGNIANTTGVKVNGATISRNYYIQRINGTNPTIGSSSSVNTIGSSGYVLPSVQIDISKINFSIGDKVCETVSINPSTGKVRADNGTIYGPTSPAVSPPACKSIVNKPYVSFYGGDVNTCGEIKTFYDNGAGRKRGSGVQYVAQANKNITEFISGSLLPNVSSRKLLSFANTGNNVYGQGLGGTCSAPGDYFSGAPTPAENAPITINPSSLNGNTVKSYNGNTVLSGGVLNNSSRTALYIDGDLRITGDIGYANSTWSNEEKIPSLHVYVKGNIYIQPNVKNLTGFFVAQQKVTTDTKGNIFTCANVNVRVTTNQLNSCALQLSVRGAFSSKRTYFDRVANSLRNGVAQETYDKSSAAEKFYIGPEMYFVSPGASSTGGGTSSGDGYQFITTLPPVL